MGTGHCLRHPANYLSKASIQAVLPSALRAHLLNSIALQIAPPRPPAQLRGGSSCTDSSFRMPVKKSTLLVFECNTNRHVPAKMYATAQGQTHRHPNMLFQNSTTLSGINCLCPEARRACQHDTDMPHLSVTATHLSPLVPCIWSHFVFVR